MFNIAIDSIPTTKIRRTIKFKFKHAYSKKILNKNKQVRNVLQILLTWNKSPCVRRRRKKTVYKMNKHIYN